MITKPFLDLIFHSFLKYKDHDSSSSNFKSVQSRPSLRYSISILVNKNFFRNGQEWLEYRRILNRVLLHSDSTSIMNESCKKAAQDLVNSWKLYSDKGNIIPNLENQLYQWSVEGDK